MVDTYHTEKGDEVANMVLYMKCLLLALYIYLCAISKTDLFVSNQTAVCTIHISNKTVILQSLIFVIYFKQIFSFTNYLCHCGSHYKRVHIYSNIANNLL
jgi:hypothetical protein